MNDSEMNNPAPQSASPEAVIRTGKIILGALIFGVLSLGGFAFAIDAKPNGDSILTALGAGMAGLQMAVWVFLPGLLTRRQLHDLNTLRDDEQTGRLAQVYLSKKIIGAALLEGAALFNWVCYIVERKSETLIVVATLVVLMGSMFPTQTQFENWATDMKRDLQ